MTEYRIEQRPVLARILTVRGWLRGTFHPPRAAWLVDYFNHAPPFINITQVIADGGTHVLPHLTLQKRAITCVVPQSDTHLEAPLPPDHRVEHGVYCLLREGSLSGRLHVLPHIRVSDYFMNREGFVLIQHGVGRFGYPEVEHGPEQLGTVLLNTWNVIGVSEVG